MMLLPLMAAVLLSQSPATAEPLPRRYALLIGANRGLAADEPLRFADSDARRMFSLFREAGGLLPEDAQFVTGADAARVRSALETLRARMARHAGPADQLVVYVSSHADGDSLHLSGTRLPVKELVRFVEEAPVGVAVMFIDSCRSGAATRVKGIQPVEERLVQWSTPAIQGRVIVTSSSADELSQESDDIQGSYFTHHLLAGLRGAGDLTKDGRVTLQEAYTYAYGRTVESTLLTRAGTQHPEFLFDLKGQGELVLTAPVSASSQLVIAVPEPGEWVVASEDGGVVLGVFSKGSGPVMLAVPPGGYRLRVRRDTAWLETRVTVPARGVAAVDAEVLRHGTLVASRGKMAEDAWRGGVSVGGTFATRTGGNLSSATGVQVLAAFHAPLVPRVAEALFATASWRSSRSTRWEDFRQREWELRLGLGPRFRGGEGTLLVGPEVGLLFLEQTAPGTSRTGLAPYGGVGASLWLDLGPVAVVLAGTAGAARIPEDSGPRLTARFGASGGVGWNF
ncbi:caspase family protein [Myxococcus sp. RHSTA-1-4]|uniref:caspase family protein n=1 Tax=Myxococcus sp. RHSTA-1-4 TaxID=2874601 RepID=UPI001CBF0A2E|nr:caspase family protein [Myxococcus sp. RHSTA-1-4]MBZ4423017.1 caspase family protein [Myxococcus sp. RHSTA-1-4]